MLDKDLFEIGTYAIGSILIYKSLISGLGQFAGSKSQKINSQLELEQVVKKNRKEMNINPDYKIKSEFIKYSTKAESEKLDENYYRISIGNVCANESIVKHELYHIKKGHCEEKSILIPGWARYWIWEEPSAIFYQLTKLKQ